ncbi:hypothetical protein GWI33_014329 [Rhynchophorus ferrugineus]|uniref:Uncharacterized protein n=1 Tax=Rhynchophorus ferrugineus TaxID=354439 RepID=A0A834M700_RHYFE|nr:hypothetical protein GWI33_014329 [Rhynchophorus ferrugineus]
MVSERIISLDAHHRTRRMAINGPGPGEYLSDRDRNISVPIIAKKIWPPFFRVSVPRTPSGRRYSRIRATTDVPRDRILLSTANKKRACLRFISLPRLIRRAAEIGPMQQVAGHRNGDLRLTADIPPVSCGDPI